MGASGHPAPWTFLDLGAALLAATLWWQAVRVAFPLDSFEVEPIGIATGVLALAGGAVALPGLACSFVRIPGGRFVDEHAWPIYGHMAAISAVVGMLAALIYLPTAGVSLIADGVARPASTHDDAAAIVLALNVALAIVEFLAGLFVGVALPAALAELTGALDEVAPSLTFFVPWLTAVIVATALVISQRPSVSFVVVAGGVGVAAVIAFIALQWVADRMMREG